ncbi:hypothetical protein M2163_008987 [Streptomyces sp. SAI-135]|nr:hypothetical protein [Streptomyces sp. SAI-090]MDH6565310.1 hypothetical protein [Streptomyces sp. SAI-117]MDH6621879.1 hypothetical protein [Streptomyces sp. SAI-135]
MVRFAGSPLAGPSGRLLTQSCMTPMSASEGVRLSAVLAEERLEVLLQALAENG